MRKKKILENFLQQKGKYVLLGLCTLLPAVCSQAQQVETSVDTTAIKIGEELLFSISVETDSDTLVVFPEGQTFMPLEVISSYPVDTSTTNERIQLLKTYGLTQFDSGRYTIPQQRIMIGDRPYLTDSLLVEVATVEVDTTKQKMFPIKPSVEVRKGFSFFPWIWWVVGVLVLLLIGYLIIRRRKKVRAEAQRLPPYDQALFELKKLDDSDLLEKREVKEYYSQLSAAVRRYLDEEVYDHAMESTTGELITYLEAERQRGKLHLQPETIDRLRKILERADLAKFANSRPDLLTAREDRSQVEMVINDTKESIPQPTEEELLQDLAYRKQLERKKRRRHVLFGLLGLVLLLSAGVLYIISTKGMDYFSQSILGNENKELLEGEWITSEYGNPPVTISTPEVLIRKMDSTTASGKETFVFGDLKRPLFIALSTAPAGDDFKLEAAVEEVYAYLEKKGATNIITKQEKLETLNGAEGLKIFGTMTIEAANGATVEKAYQILNFGLGGYQQIVIIYDQGDTYGQEIAERIVDSVELINDPN